MAEFVPRLTSDGIYGNYWWYDRANIYYPAHQLPNCTCYCYGRWGEIRGAFADLPGYDAKYWFDAATNFERGSVPQLGAIACYGYDGTEYAGHVAVVEVINNDGSITLSNSGYPDSFFWVETVRPEEGWLENYMIPRNYYFQGFIYIDVEPVPPQPTPVYSSRKHRFPIWMYGI